MRRFLIVFFMVAVLTTLVATIQVTAQQGACPEAPPTRFSVGMHGMVRPADSRNVPNSARIRETPGKDGKLIANLAEGIPFVVLEGPQCQDGLLWWKIKADNGVIGWTAEGDKDKYYFMPIGAEATGTFSVRLTPQSIIAVDCPDTPPTRFAIGVRGIVRSAAPGDTPNSLRIHDKATIQSPILVYLPENRPFTIVDGPQCADGYIWWKLKSDDGGVTGWAAEGDTSKYYYMPLVSESSVAATIVPYTGNPRNLNVVAIACTEALPTRFGLGVRGQVTQHGPVQAHTQSALNSAATSQTNALKPTNGLLTPGTTFAIIGGPECVSGQIRWIILTSEGPDGIAGWVSEADGGIYLIEPTDKITLLQPTATAVPTMTLVFTPAPPLATPVFVPNMPLTTTPFKAGLNEVYSVTFSGDGRYVLTGGHDPIVRLWNMADGTQVREFRGYTASVTSVAFSPDGSTVLAGPQEGTMYAWDVASGQIVKRFPVAGCVQSVAFSPDGKQVLVGGLDGIASLWDFNTQAKLREFRGHQRSIWSVAFSPDGQQVLTGSLDHTAILWNAASGNILRYFVGHRDAITGVAFSPDGKQVLTGSLDSTARLWDIVTGKILRQFGGDDLYSVAFSHDGKSILTGGLSHVVRLWNVASGQVVRQFVGHGDYIPGLAFSPDDQTILTGSPDRTARLWDIATGKEIRHFPIKL